MTRKIKRISKKQPDKKRKISRRTKSKKAPLSHAMNVLKKYSNRHWFHSFENAECLKCSETHRLMIRVGALSFCIDCFPKIFNVKDKERNPKIYSKWLKVYNEKVDYWFNQMY